MCETIEDSFHVVPFKNDPNPVLACVCCVLSHWIVDVVSCCYTIVLLYYTANATATAVAATITLDSDRIHRPSPVLGQGLETGSYC